MKAAPLGLGTSDAHAEFMKKMDCITKDMAVARDKNGLAMSEAKRRGEAGHEGQLIAWDPQYDKGDNTITQALIKSIDTSTKEILLTSNYVNGTTEVRNALIAAAKRGVKVTVMTSSLAVSALSTMPYLNAERFYGDLMAAGITIRETTRFEHGKMYLFDNKVAAFGSYNVEHPADNMLAEGMIFTKDPAMVKMISDNLHDTLEHRTKAYVKRNFWENIAVFFTRILAWFLEPFI
jgi:phosphatidylserine/phosphatidylglycerophosphate/cardiolipin synthase-like enzyme